MTWDATVYAVLTPPERFPDDFTPVPMGPVDDVKRRIGDALPGIVWSGATGVFSDGECPMELVLWGTDAPAVSGIVDRVTVTALGNAHLVGLLGKLCVPNGWVAFDDAEGSLVDLQVPTAVHSRERAVDGKTGAARRRHIIVMKEKHTQVPLGDAAGVREALLRVPGITDGEVLIHVGAQFRMELRIPPAGAAMTLEIYAVGAGVDEAVLALCRRFGWLALDEERGWLT